MAGRNYIWIGSDTRLCPIQHSSKADLKLKNFMDTDLPGYELDRAWVVQELEDFSHIPHQYQTLLSSDDPPWWDDTSRFIVAITNKDSGEFILTHLQLLGYQDPICVSIHEGERLSEDMLLHIVTVFAEEYEDTSSSIYEMISYTEVVCPIPIQRG